MESMKQSIMNMEKMFKERMTVFQGDLQNLRSSPPASPHNQLEAEFAAFRTMVIESLNSLQSQVELLMKISDEQEMRSRRKFLLLHGVTEDKQEKLSSIASLLSSRLGLSDLTDDSISRFHRLGSLKEDKPRPILLKFCKISVKDTVWTAKTKLKGSGITLSEFLTKRRHEVFMAARKCFGIARCWTTGGRILVVASDGSRRRVECIEDIDAIAVNETKACTQSTESKLAPVAPNKLVRPRRLHNKVK